MLTYIGQRVEKCKRYKSYRENIFKGAKGINENKKTLETCSGNES